jgi:hypothetical protein
MEQMMQKLKLAVNPQKTRLCRVPQESFDCLGYTLGRCYRFKTGAPYLGTKPSKKAVAKLCEKIRQMTHRQTCGRDAWELVGELKRGVEWVGPLLPTWFGYESLLRGRPPRAAAAAPMVVPEAQGQRNRAGLVTPIST